MKPHQERVVAESHELRDRLNKLAAFIKGDIFPTLDREDRQLLERQSYYMTDYLEVLRKRIARFT